MMKSRNLRTSVLILAALGFSGAVQAKGIDSGGGGAIVCRNADGTIKSAELLDLWEAKVDGFAVLRDSQESHDAQARRAIERLWKFNPTLARKVAVEYTSIQLRSRSLPEGVTVSPPSDALNDLQQNGCAIEGVAKYNDTKDNLYYDEWIYGAMAPTDRAALWVHESIYRVLRQSEDAQDSRRTRALVGRIFSERNPFSGSKAETPWSPWSAAHTLQNCSSASGSEQAVVGVNEESGDVQVFITRVGGYWVTSPATFKTNRGQNAAMIVNRAEAFKDFYIDERICEEYSDVKRSPQPWWELPRRQCAHELNWTVVPGREFLPIKAPLVNHYVLRASMSAGKKPYLRLYPTTHNMERASWVIIKRDDEIRVDNPARDGKSPMEIIIPDELVRFDEVMNCHRVDDLAYE